MVTAVRDLKKIDPRHSYAVNVNIIRDNLYAMTEYMDDFKNEHICIVGISQNNYMKCISLLRNWRSWLQYKNSEQTDDLIPEITTVLAFYKAGLRHYKKCLEEAYA